MGAHAVEADAPGVGVLEVGAGGCRGSPSRRAASRPRAPCRDLVGEPGAGRGLQEVEGGVLVARREEAEGDQPAVGAGREPAERGQAAGIDGYGIDQGRGLAVLLREIMRTGWLCWPCPSMEEQSAARRERSAEAAALQEREARLDLLAAGQAVEHAAARRRSGRRSRRDTRASRARVGLRRLGSRAAFEPAVGIDEIDAVEEDFADGFDFRRR